MKKLLLLIGMLSLAGLGFAQVSKQQAVQRPSDYALSSMPKEWCSEYFNADVPPISNLEISVGENDSVFIDWGYPESFEPREEVSLSWSIGDMMDQLGGPCGECNWTVAHRYEEKDLDELFGWRIKSVAMIPWRSIDTYEIRIWEGSIENCTLVFSKTLVDPILGHWNTIEIDEDIFLERGRDYFFGYKAYAVGGYFLPIDDRYGVRGKGNLIEMNPSEGWTTNSDLGLPWGNYMISTTLENTMCREEKRSNLNNDVLTGYRIYRNDDLIAEIPYTFQTYFTDTEFTRGFETEYCITAVYGDEESEPVCATAMITGVGEGTKAYGITVAPNPTNGQVTITGQDLIVAEVFNMLGQRVATATGEGERLHIDIANLPEGIYFVSVTDVNGRKFVRKVLKE